MTEGVREKRERWGTEGWTDTHRSRDRVTEKQRAKAGRGERECECARPREGGRWEKGGGWRLKKGARRNIKAIVPLINCKPRGPGQRPAPSRDQSEDQFRDPGGVRNIPPGRLSIWNAFLHLYLLAPKGSFKAHPERQLLCNLY